MLRNMSIALLKHERITTTLAKAKELRPFVEKLVTRGRENHLHVRRSLLSILRDNVIVNKLFSNISLRFKDRQGGYLRILKKGFRNGDCASMAIIEFVDYNVE